MKILMIKCDRCGTLYDEKENALNMTLYEKSGDYSDYDFCPKCSGLLLDFITNSDKNMPEFITSSDEEVVVEQVVPKVENDTCEHRCYLRRLEHEDFNRCFECAHKDNCPDALNDCRCNESKHEEIVEPKECKPVEDQNNEKYHWTDKELNFLYENYKSMSSEEIAFSLGRSISSVRNKLNKLGLHALRKRGKNVNGRRTFQKWELDYIRENYDSMTIKMLGEALNRHPSSIRLKMKELGLME